MVCNLSISQNVYLPLSSPSLHPYFLSHGLYSKAASPLFCIIFKLILLNVLMLCFPSAWHSCPVGPFLILVFSSMCPFQFHIWNHHWDYTWILKNCSFCLVLLTNLFLRVWSLKFSPMICFLFLFVFPSVILQIS